MTAADFLEKLETAVTERTAERMTAMQYAEKLIADKEHKKKNTRLGERIQKIFSTRRVFHSAGMCLLEAKGFHPCRQVGFAGVSIEYLAVQEFGTGAAWREFFVGLAHTAAARCGKGDDGFTF